MKKVALGTTGETVSALCLGCMYLGTRVDERNSMRILDVYAESGGQFLDTANCYAFWVPGGTGNESEAILGAWMKARGNRSRIILATKVGARPSPRGNEGLSSVAIERAVHESLHRLSTDCIDLLYTHVPDPATPLEETLEALDKLVHAGKVRFIGCSNEPAWRVERARHLSRSNGWASFCCIQNRHTYLRPKPRSVLPQVCFDDETLEYAKDSRVTLLAYSPLLGGAYAREESLLPQEYSTSDSHERWKVLDGVAQRLGATRSAVVLAWLMAGSPALIPLVAASRESQLRENLGAEALVLDAGQMHALTDAVG